jgi:Flp pilus assembly protein TadG
MLNRFIRDKRGVAAVEFALTAPIMLLFYCGLAELTMAMMADRRASHTAAVIGDLVAQESQVSKAEVADIMKIGTSIMDPFPSTDLSMRLTSIQADASGTPKVRWSQVNGSFAKLSGTVSGMPAGLIAANESVVMAETSFNYTSVIKNVVPSGITLTQKYYLRPRKASEVICSDC